MKTYTTPTITIQCEGSQEFLSKAQSVLITIKGHNTAITKPAVINEDVLSVTLTQEESGRLGAGRLAIEITCVSGDTVIKSETLYTTLEQAVFQEVMDHA